MDNSWRHLPPPARPIAGATAGAIAALRAGAEPDETLAAQDPALTGLILGTVVRLLLEDGHPDGLDADDVREVLAACVRAWPAADPQVMLWLLAGALGVLDEDGAPAPAPDVLARHAAALVDHLLAGRPVEPWLTAGLGEIQRTQQGG